MSALAGKRTYIVSFLLIVLAVLKYFEVIDQDLFLEIGGLLGAGGLAALRAAKK